MGAPVTERDNKTRDGEWQKAGTGHWDPVLKVFRPHPVTQESNPQRQPGDYVLPDEVRDQLPAFELNDAHKGPNFSAWASNPAFVPYVRAVVAWRKTHARQRLFGVTQTILRPDLNLNDRGKHCERTGVLAWKLACVTKQNPLEAYLAAIVHDAGHVSFGHAVEYALSRVKHRITELREHKKFDHAPVGDLIVLRMLEGVLGLPKAAFARLLSATGHHSMMLEGDGSVLTELVSLADRAEYAGSDLCDALKTGLIGIDDLPPEVAILCGEDPRNLSPEEIRDRISLSIVKAVEQVWHQKGVIGWPAEYAVLFGAVQKFTTGRMLNAQRRQWQEDVGDKFVEAFEHLCDDPQMQRLADVQDREVGSVVLRQILTWTDGDALAYFERYLGTSPAELVYLGGGGLISRMEATNELSSDQTRASDLGLAKQLAFVS